MAFLIQRFPISQESEQNLLVGKCRVYLGQSNHHTIPIGGFHQGRMPAFCRSICGM
jgi:hypothetical protein